MQTAYVLSLKILQDLSSLKNGKSLLLSQYIKKI